VRRGTRLGVPDTRPLEPAAGSGHRRTVSLSALALLVTLAPTALEVRLEEARGVAPAEAEALVARLRERTARMSGSGTLRVRALATPGALRVTLVWTAAAQPTLARATLVGPPEAWGAALDEAFAVLGLHLPPQTTRERASVDRAGEAAARQGDDRAVPPAISVAPPHEGAAPALSPTQAPPTPVLGLSLLGTSVVAGAVAVALGVMNQSARDEGNPLPAGRARDALDERALATGLGANVLWGVAAAALVTGGWLVLSAE
jgi:hypothetical protein